MSSRPSTHQILLGILFLFLMMAIVISVLIRGTQKFQAAINTAPPAPATTEFVCERDGVLVERHVGVASAVGYNSGVWRITYIEGNSKSYFQQPGETCGLESY